MEDNFNQNDFEDFLQDQVRNHRMYPTDAVWREIDKKLHGEKRWPALTIAALMLLSATTIICVYFTPKPNLFVVQPSNVNTTSPAALQKDNILNNLSGSTPFANGRRFFASPIAKSETALQAATRKIIGDPVDENAISTVNGVAERVKTAVAVPPLKSQATIRIPVASYQKGSDPVAGTVTGKPDTKATGSEQNLSLATKDTRKAVAENVKNATQSSFNKDADDKNMVDEFLKEHPADVALHSASKKFSQKHRFSYQIYIAPSISYRTLLEDNSMAKETNSGPVALNYVADVNKVVRHKPGTGIELGVAFMYNLSNSVRVKSGFQFNMRQYSIEAYRSSTELASIALMGNNRIDTVKTLSFYRNNNGYYSAELVNRYYQVSVPIGIEWQVVGNKKVQLNVAGTIQPTYLLNRNAYLLSTNFKNYTESPGIVRQWNINSNIEAFISVKVGDFKWQLGPQLRYQPYSTFIPEYPIKEHLMDYGLKLGVSKMIN
jgi:hypothetical protein